MLTLEPANKSAQLRRDPLEPFFHPRSVAVIGATETPGSVGRTLLSNLISAPFGGAVFPVNPKRASVLGIQSYPSIAAIPDQVDLAVIATPASTVAAVVRECGEAGVPAAVVISAGFKETGAGGAALEREVIEEARRAGMRIIGPNCLGVMNPLTGLNATFAHPVARPGNVAFISQSGAMCTAVLDWSLKENVGFSAFVSIGSMGDIGWGDLIDYLGGDFRTHSIVLYMESIGDARSFLSAAREVALTKPIIVIKGGRSDAAAHAAASHTGALTGSDAVVDAAFRRVGVLRVNHISDIFYMTDVLAKQPRPKGPRLVIISNAGGPAVLATDALLAQGGELAVLSPDTKTRLDAVLPPHWSHSNPIDVIGDADAERYRNAVEIAASDPNADGMLIIMTPQGMTDPTQVAERVKQFAKIPDKPVLASWMGGASVVAGRDILSQAGLPVFAFPDSAVRAFTYMWRYSYNLRALYETPSLAADSDAVIDRDAAARMIARARESGRRLLTESESKQLLATYGIPALPAGIALSEDEAVAAAERIGYPVVLKLHSETITHKTDVGGVKLNITGAEAVRRAWREIRQTVIAAAAERDFLGVTVQPMIPAQGYEIIVGSSIDPQFGPVIVFGTGGQLVEVFKDRALALPPLNTTLARRLIEQTRISQAFKGVRGRKPVDSAALEAVLVRFSQLVLEQKWIKEIDINPLHVSHERIVALDARIVLHDPSTTERDLPRPAIRPYPTRYVSEWRMGDGAAAVIRPIRPEDEPLVARFHQNLSDRSVYFRYFHQLRYEQRVSHERLTRVCFIDYDRQMALVAESRNPESGEHEILGIARLVKLRNDREAEFAVLVADRYQGRGVGSELLRRTIEFARDEGIERIVGYVLAENTAMQKLCQRAGFRLRYEDATTLRAELNVGTNV
jgi:acetyltransferase